MTEYNQNDQDTFYVVKTGLPYWPAHIESPHREYGLEIFYSTYPLIFYGETD